jgi:Tol biopolymer transport system component
MKAILRLTAIALALLPATVACNSSREAGSGGGGTDRTAYQIAFLSHGYCSGVPRVCGANLFLIGADGSNLTRLTDTRVANLVFDWAPDGQHFVFFSGYIGDWKLQVVDLEGNVADLGVSDMEPNWDWSPDGSQIAFDLGAGAGVYVANANGSNPRRIADGSYPAWSPDGRQIAFGDYREGPQMAPGVFVINADGTGEVEVAKGVPIVLPEGEVLISPGGPPRAKLSPNGERLAFLSRGTFITVNRDGTNLVEVAPPVELGSALFHNWVWSPDGTKIASDDGHGGLYISNGDGSGARRVADGSDPRWSPDGTQVLFSVMLDPAHPNDDIYVVNADGTGLSRLTDHPAYDRWPEWSPDGSRILFTSNREYSWNAYVMNSDGSAQTSLRGPFDPFLEGGRTGFASWSPDGKLIVFDGPGADIYVANADGTDVRNLTDTDWAYDSSPVWSPVLPQEHPVGAVSTRP